MFFQDQTPLKKQMAICIRFANLLRKNNAIKHHKRFENSMKKVIQVSDRQL